MAATEPPTKKAKTEEEKPAEETKAESEEAKAPKEEEKELEENATKIKGNKIKASVGFPAHETTLNIAETMFGNMLTCMSDGGLQYFLGGARANVGVKSGRYMFEMNVVELMHQTQPPAGTITGKPPQPRNFFRVGVSTAASSLLIGEDTESICFDAVGDLIHNKKKTPVGAKFERSMTVGCVLNLDASSPNANTISLFRDGVRICKPQALPESLVGKTLYPTATFRNVTVHYNFGPVPRAPLPFTCHMLQEAGDKDVEITPEVAAGSDGKFTAVFPVTVPDEGGFQWLDSWLAKNPGYTELSDRAILNWAQKSGIARLKPYNARSSNDKPEMNFGLPTLDDKSVQKLLASTASMQRRNFIVVEMQKMLLAEERQALLSKFSDFKRVAMMAIGEPPAAFKALTQESLLKEKQAVSDADFKKKLQVEKMQKAEAKKKKEAEKKKKAEEKAKAKEAAERKKKLEEAVKKREEEKKKKAEAEKIAKAEAEKIAKGEAVEEKKEEEEAAKEEPKEEEAEVKEETKEETKEEEKEEEEEEAEEMEVDQPDPEPPVVELTAEEKKMWFRTGGIPDITSFDVNKNFTKYSLPEKSEGFDEMKYEWQPAAKCADHLTKWRLNKKVTARVEDLVIGDWFTTNQEGWSKFLTSLKTKQNEYKAALAKKAVEKANKEKIKKMKAAAKVAAAKKAEEEKKAAAAKKAKEEEAKKAAAAKAAAEKKEGEDEAMEEAKEEAEEAKPMEVEETKAEETTAEEVEEEAEEEEEEEPEVDLMSVEVFDVDDIFDVGGNPKKSLFNEFQFEDWSLMSLRFELSLLVHAFKKDVKDPERTGIHLDNIAFYYQKYFRKTLTPQFFGLKTVKELIGLVSDSLAISDKNILHTCMPENLEALNMYVLLTEEARRDRQRRIDLGEEGASIKMQMQTGGSWNNQGGGAQPNAGVAALIQMQREKLAQSQAGNTAGTGTTVRPTMPASVAPAGGIRPVQQPGVVRPAAGFGPQATGGWRPQAAAPQPWAARPTAPSWAAAAQRPAAFNASGSIRPAWRG